MKTRNIWLALMAGVAVLTVAQAGWAADCRTGPQQAAAGACNVGQSCVADGCCDSCCGSCLQFYGEFLYLRPRNAGVEYAVPINGPIGPAPGVVPLQMGHTAALDPQFEPGFRIGGDVAFDNCSSIEASFTHYENTTDDAITTTAPLVIRSMVMHPSSLDASNGLARCQRAWVHAVQPGGHRLPAHVLVQQLFPPRLPGRRPLRQPRSDVPFRIQFDHHGQRRHTGQLRRGRHPARPGGRTPRLEQSLPLRQGFGELLGRRIPRTTTCKAASPTP